MLVTGAIVLAFIATVVGGALLVAWIYRTWGD